VLLGEVAKAAEEIIRNLSKESFTKETGETLWQRTGYRGY